MNERGHSAGIRYALVFLVMFFIIAPFYWIYSSSIKESSEIVSQAPTLVPRAITFQHYDNLLSSSDYSLYLANSALVSLATMAITVVLSTSAAYGLYRLPFPGRKTLYRLILLAYIFPGSLLLIPLYVMLSGLKLLDTQLALVIINVTFAAPFSVWLLKAFFASIPFELEEAASLDGASWLQTLLRVVLPLASPGVASVAIFAFITSWTEYMFASVLIISDARRTLPVGLAGVIGQYVIDWGLLLAGAGATTLPIILLFVLIGRFFVKGLLEGGVKA